MSSISVKPRCLFIVHSLSLLALLWQTDGRTARDKKQNGKADSEDFYEITESDNVFAKRLAETAGWRRKCRIRLTE
ncbi:hypothetical protein CQA31_08445 [Citrobacter freundii]|nr:hypothetical protein CQA28_02960 [Citrobacter freundii]PCQ47933.1 hypothetical protein CQA31_08445 [Citrobacter freundii]